MRKFVKVQSRMDPVVQTLIKHYLEALNRLRLGEDISEAFNQEVEVGMRGETEFLEPYIAFTYHTEF